MRPAADDQGGMGVTVAPLTNVSLAYTAMARAVERPDHLPGMITFAGPSGWGKSRAAAYVANKFKAYYVECDSTMTRKAMLLAIAQRMNLRPAGTIYDLLSQVARELADSGRPLILDDFHHIVRKGGADLARDLYKRSLGAILLIGEEMLPSLLARHEQVANRQLDWISALPASLDDARLLARLYVPDVEIAADLLAHIHKLASGSVERICVNLERVRRETLSIGENRVDLARWGNRELFTGEARRRVG